MTRVLVPVFVPALIWAASATTPLAQETQAERDVGFIQGLIEDNLSDTGRQVIIEGFEGALSSRATIESLTIADDEGIWLRAEGLTLEWTRSALLGGALEVSELSADLIELVRPPIPTDSIDVPSPEATPFEFALPDLPVSIQIDALQADRIVLGAPVLGQEYAFDIGAAITLDDGEGSATINANRLDAAQGRFDIDVSYSNTSRILGLTVDLAEAEDGITARALGIPGRPSVALSLDGTGPVDAYDAALTIATDGVDRITGRFGFLNSGAGQELTLDVRGDVNALISNDYEEFFGPDTRLVIQGARDEAGALTLSQLLIEAQSLNLQGAAALAANGWPQRLDLTGRLASQDGTPVLFPFIATETYIGDATFDLTFNAEEGDAWTTELEVTEVDQPDLDIARLRLSGGGVIREGNGIPALVAGDLAYTAQGLAPRDAALARALGREISGDLVFEQAGDAPFEISSLTLTGPGIEAAARARLITDDTARIESSVQLEAEDLARFGLLTGLGNLSGAAELDVQANIQPLDGIFDISLAGDTTNLALGIAELDPQIGGNGQLTLTAARDTEGTRIEAFSLDTPGLRASGTADLTSTGSTATFTARLADIGLSIPDLIGPATLDGTLNLGTDGAGQTQVALRLPGTDATITADIAAPDAGGLITLDLAAEVADIAPYGDIAGRPLGGAADLTVTGTLSRDTTRADLQLTAATTDLQIGMAEVDALLAGTTDLSTRLRRLSQDAFRVEGLRLDGPRMAGRIDAALTAGDLAAELDLSLTDLADVLANVAGSASLAGRITRSAQGDITADLDATGPGAATAMVEASLTAGMAFDGDIRAAAGDLAAYAALLPEPMSGAAAIGYSGTVANITTPAETEFDGQLSVEGADLAYGTTTLPGQVTLSGPLTRLGDDVTLDLAATAPAQTAAAITGTLDLAEAGFDGQARITTADIARFAALAGVDARGQITASVEGLAALDLSSLDLALDLEARDLGYDDLAMPGAVDLTGTANRTGDIITTDLTLAAPGETRARITAALDQARETVSGTMSVQARDLAPYSSLAGRELSGQITTDLQGTARLDASTWDAGFDIAGRDLAAGGIALSGGIDLTGTSARSTDGRTTTNLSGTAPGDTAIDLSLQGTEVLDTALTLSVGSLQTYAGLIGQPLSGSARATLQGTVTPADLTFDLGFDGQTTNINPGIAQVASLLRGAGDLSGRVARSADGTLTLRDARLRYPNITANADLTQQGGATSGQFDARLTDVGLFTDALSGPATAQGRASISSAGVTQLDISATGPGGTEADVSGTVAAGGQLDLRIDGQAPLALANGFIEPRRVDGTASFNLAVNGPPEVSSATGTIRIAGGRLATPTLRRALEDIGGSVTLTGSSALIDLGGSLEDGGRITVAGPVGLTGGFDAGLRIAGAGLILRDPTLYETTVDAEITITGPLAGGAQISGGIALGETEIQVPSSTASALGPLPQVTHIGAPRDVRQTLDRAGLTLGGVDISDSTSSSGPGYGLDITISAPSRVFIRGRGLDAELGGALRISGTTNQIIPIGGFSLIRGRIDILEQRFALTEGSADLQGDFDPFLRLVATTEAPDGTEVSIIVEGPASAPEVTFTSSPELPQDEVLARLIFGRDLSSISPFQAIQLASAVSTLAGGSSVLGEFRQGLGLDDFDVTTDEEGNTAVRAGAYISENVYTDVTVGSENTEINLNLDLTDDVRITGSTSTDGNTGIGIFFERDY